MRALPGTATAQRSLSEPSHVARTDAAKTPAIASVPTSLATFEGGGEQSAISATGNGNTAVTTPADPSLAAGGSDVVEAVNSALFVYSRTGIFIKSFGINGMIGNPTSSGYVVQYAHVVYDPMSGVFILMVLQFKTSTCGSQIVIMDSQSDPTLPWQARGTIGLDAELGSGLMLSNLSMALTGTLVVESSDYRVCSGGTLGAFAGSQTIVIQRADLVAGKATTRSASFLVGGPIGVQPVMGLGLSTVAYEIANDATCAHAASGSFAVFAITGTPDAGNVSQTCTAETDNAGATSAPPAAPQNNTSSTLATNDDRFLDAAWSSTGVLWAVGGTACTPSPGSCLNVVDVSASSTGVVTIAPSQLAAKGVSGAYLYDPSIAVDSSNDAFVTFDESSTSAFESMVLATIPNGTTTWSSPVTVNTSGNFYSPGGCSLCAWGDYSTAVQDPLHPTDVWVVSSDTDGVTSANCATVNSCWNTWVARYTFQPPSVNFLTPSSGTGGGGQVVTVSGSDFATGTTVTFGGTPITPSNLTADSFTFITPPGPPAGGVEHVVATDSLGSSSATSAASGFLYIPLSDYTPLSPFRILDTRGPPQNRIGQNATRIVQVTGVLGTGTTPVPSNAVAVVINVTEVNGTAGSLLTVYPTGTPQPKASNLNFAAGTVTPNLVTVTLGGSGQVSIYNSLGSVNVLVDVEGYFAPPTIATTAGEFHPILPLRVCETRSTSPTPACKSHGVLVAGSPMLVTVTGTGAGAIPSNGTAAAAVLNLTAVAATAGTFLTVYPTSTSGTCTQAASVSTINVVAGAVEANRVFVKLGPGPSGPNTAVCVLTSLGKINVVLDANGWFGTSSAVAGFQYQAIAPSRICDTRTTSVGCTAGAIGAGPTLARLVHVAGEGGVPGTTSGTVVQAVIANLTATVPSQNTFLAAYAAGNTTNTSDLNLVAGATLPNLVVVQLDTTAGADDGCIDILNAVGAVNAIIDIEGWFQ
jgi:hypothetical protein